MRILRSLIPALVIASSQVAVPSQCQEPPRIRPFSFSPDLSLGDSAAVTCAVKRGSVGPHTLTWRKDGALLPQERRISVSQPSDVMSILALRNIQPGDVGNYTCVASNAHGEHRMTALLVISGLPPRIRPFAAQEDLSLGDSTVLTCALRRGSRGPHDIVWLKGDGTAVSEEGRGGRVSAHRQSDVMSILALRDIGYEDAGSNYTCVASNVHGSDRRTAVLQVSGTAVAGASHLYSAVHTDLNSALSHQQRSADMLAVDSAELRVRTVLAALLAAVAARSSAASEAPSVREFRFPANLLPGDTAVVSCVVRKGSAGPFRLSWSKDGRPLDTTLPSISVMSHQGGSVSTLTIADVSVEHN
ncbi:hypothetical protein V5799_008403 [Amblyomma americanum]|uniref:Ig-like domain-containing protein n=1 Tax=Amblyomma americanum TaxID=6943 RepID=A0AAQ4FDH0_AMBAM